MASKYYGLGRYLRVRTASSVVMSFREVEKVLGGPLPPSARKHAAWWSNETPLLRIVQLSFFTQTLRTDTLVVASISMPN